MQAVRFSKVTLMLAQPAHLLVIYIQGFFFFFFTKTLFKQTGLLAFFCLWVCTSIWTTIISTQILLIATFSCFYVQLVLQKIRCCILRFAFGRMLSWLSGYWSETNTDWDFTVALQESAHYRTVISGEKGISCLLPTSKLFSREVFVQFNEMHFKQMPC